MKKIIYKLILKYPLTLLLLKTPLKIHFINYMKNYMKKYRFRKKNNIFDTLLSYFFWVEYYSKLANSEEIKKISDSTHADGEGRRRAEYHFNNHFKNLTNLKNQKQGFMTNSKARPIFTEIISHIKNNNLENDRNTFIIQIGSASGLDLKFFYDQFPKLNYISTEINDEILNFQKEKYVFPNFKFFKCHAEEIDQCFEQLNLKEKKIILFSVDAATCVEPYFLNIFFSKIKSHKNLTYFLMEAVDLRVIKTLKGASSKHRENICFSHNYSQYAQKNNLKIIQEQIIAPYSKNDPIHQYTGHYYLCCTTG